MFETILTINPPSEAKSTLRWPNNHNERRAINIQKLAEAVQFFYGHRYERCVSYLQSLANNVFWHDAELPDLPFHNQQPHPEGVGAPRYVLHQAALNALAPAIPLRAAFGGDRYH